MKTKFVNSGSLQEDLDALGVKGLDESAMALVALGMPMSEASKPKPEEPEDDDEEDGEDYDESRHDPIDGPFVTPALFDRIMALPFESLDDEQLAQVVEGLKSKRIPRNIPGIVEQAEVVARTLTEKMKSIIWKGKRKRITIDMSPEAKQARRERRRTSRRKRSQLKRQRIRTGRKTSAKMAAKRTAKVHQRLGDDFAVELEHLLAENQSRRETAREEILGRIDDIVDLIEDEFDDDNVTMIFNEAIEPISASYSAGRLDEDVMNVDSFLAEIRPVMALISKSVDRIERIDLGN